MADSLAVPDNAAMMLAASAAVAASIRLVKKLPPPAVGTHIWRDWGVKICQGLAERDFISASERARFQTQKLPMRPSNGSLVPLRRPIAVTVAVLDENDWVPEEVSEMPLRNKDQSAAVIDESDVFVRSANKSTLLFTLTPTAAEYDGLLWD